MIDPAAPTWTGTWRDPRFSPPGDGGRPENALTGQIFTVNCCATNMVVHAADGDMRFWRNTTVAALTGSQTTTVGTNIIGYEWDEDLDNGHRPAGSFRVSETTGNGEIIRTRVELRAGPGDALMTMYRHASGALVFGAGTIQWSWALDSRARPGFGGAAVSRAAQATVNLLADMGVQPSTSADRADGGDPVHRHRRPDLGDHRAGSRRDLRVGAAVTVTGTASDVGGGRVGGVEVSTRRRRTWRRAAGRELVDVHVHGRTTRRR